MSTSVRPEIHSRHGVVGKGGEEARGQEGLHRLHPEAEEEAPHHHGVDRMEEQVRQVIAERGEAPDRVIRLQAEHEERAQEADGIPVEAPDLDGGGIEDREAVGEAAEAPGRREGALEVVEVVQEEAQREAAGPEERGDAEDEEILPAGPPHGAQTRWTRGPSPASWKE
jgi:hypothetical protein